MTGGVVALTILLIALANVDASWSRLVVLEVTSGVSLFMGSMCVDLGCDDMFVGVGGCNGVWVPGVEFPEGSRKVNKSLIPAAFREFWVVCWVIQ